MQVDDIHGGIDDKKDGGASVVHLNSGHVATSSSSSNRHPHKIGLDLLKIIHAARQTYGLRTNDYARYHAHCVRRVATLHRATGLLNRAAASHSTNKKKTAATDNKSKSKLSTTANFKSTTSQVNASAVLKDERLLELLLWETERAWSEAMREREQVASLEQQQQQQQQEKNTKQNNFASIGSIGSLAHKRHRYLKRFKRASQHSQKLSSIARELWQQQQDSFSPSSAFQIEIYDQYMKGMCDFAKSSSSSSNARGKSPSQLQALATAYNLLDGYAQITQSATEEALAFELLDELEPMIRFCAYKSGEHRQSTVVDIAKTIGQSFSDYLEAKEAFPGAVAKLQREEKAMARKRKEASKPVHQLVWRDIDVPVRSAELAEALGKVQHALSELSSHQQGKSLRRRGGAAPETGGESTSVLDRQSPRHQRVSAYEKGLAVLIEAEDRAHKLVEDNSTALAKAHSARFEAASKPLALAHSYIAFQLYCMRLQRDNALFQETLKRLSRRESKVHGSDSQAAAGPLSPRLQRRRMKLYPILIKLLDGMVQTLETARDLNVVEQDTSDLADQVELSLLRYQTLRCRYLSETYALLTRFPEAESLLQRARLYLRQLSNLKPSVIEGSEDGASGLDSILPKETEVERLVEDLESMDIRLSTDWYVFTLAETTDEAHSSATPEEASIDGVLGGLSLDNKLPRNIRRRKAKRAGPVFFDVAFNYIAAIDHDALLPHYSARAPVKEVQPEFGVESSPQFTESAGEVASAKTKDVLETSASDGKKGIWGFFSRSK